MTSRDALADALRDRDRRAEHLRGASRELSRRHTDATQTLAALDTAVRDATQALRSLGQARVDWGDFNRTAPYSVAWGADRGRCVDRYYIEQFLGEHTDDIRGTVLEVHDDDYTRRFGAGRVTHSDVIDINPANRRATIVADLRRADGLPADRYDCLILTQTLQFIYELHDVLRQCVRMLKPGGVMLATLACASRVAPAQGVDGDYWRFTASAARRFFGEYFEHHRVHVCAYGNVFVDVAFLYGLACEDVTDDEFAVQDPYFPLIVAVRAQK